MLLDLTQPVEKSQDLFLLHEILGALVGQPCLQVKFSYGGELKLDFGRSIAYSSPKMKDKLKGSWRLGVRASGWRMVFGEVGLMILNGLPEENGLARYGTEITDEKIEEKAQLLAGKTILRLTPSFAATWAGSEPSQQVRHEGIELAVLFEDGSTFRIVPGRAADSENEADGGESVADWELFTPYQTYIRSGPGLVWSLRRSDVVAKVG